MQERLYASLLKQLSEMPLFFRRSLADLPREALLRQPNKDKSHLLEHLWHAVDCDAHLYGLRIRRILAEDRPLLQSVEVGRWPEAHAYASRDGDAAIAEFERGRVQLLGELQALTADQLDRVGRRVDGTEVSALEVIEQLVDHDQDHRWRIAAIFREFAGWPASRD